MNLQLKTSDTYFVKFNKQLTKIYFMRKRQMTEKMENIIEEVVQLYKQGNWKAIVSKYRDHPDRNRLLWVYPTEENFKFIRNCMKKYHCDEILSIGCGSGLLEWMITEATGFPVSGVEVDGAWWKCKYAPPTFIPLLFTTMELDKDAIGLLHRKSTALLFCYFNNRPALKLYLEHYSGQMIIIIGPDGKGVHTDPKPFGDMPTEWTLYVSQEVGDTKDFIAVYRRTNMLINNTSI